MGILEVALLVGVVQGISLGVGLMVKNWGKPYQNRFFYVLLFLICVALVGKLSYSPARYQNTPHIWFFFDLLAYTIGPLWYFTLQKSFRPKLRLGWEHYLLLIPSLYYVCFLGFILTLSETTLLTATQQSEFRPSFYIFCLTALVVNGGFVWKARNLLRKSKAVGFPPLLAHGQYAMLGILILWLLGLIAHFVVITHFDIAQLTYHLGFLSLAFFTFGMAFLAFVQPTAFHFLTQVIDTEEINRLKELANRIKRHLDEEQSFLTAKFNLGELATAVDANPVLTSKAINRQMGTTFADLINEQRIQYFLRLHQEGKGAQLTHWALAQESGFGNKATFYKTFRKHFGTTPKAYFDSLSNPVHTR